MHSWVFSLEISFKIKTSTLHKRDDRWWDLILIDSVYFSNGLRQPINRFLFKSVDYLSSFQICLGMVGHVTMSEIPFPDAPYMESHVGTSNASKFAFFSACPSTLAIYRPFGKPGFREHSTWWRTTSRSTVSSGSILPVYVFGYSSSLEAQCISYTINTSIINMRALDLDDDLLEANQYWRWDVPTSQDGLHFGNISQNIRVDSICLVVPLPSFSMTTRITVLYHYYIYIFRRPGKKSNLSNPLICRYYGEVGQPTRLEHPPGSWFRTLRPADCGAWILQSFSSDQMPCLFSLQREKIGKQGTKWQSLSGSTSKTDQNDLRLSFRWFAFEHEILHPEMIFHLEPQKSIYKVVSLEWWTKSLHRKWLAITISIHFELVVCGSRHGNFFWIQFAAEICFFSFPNQTWHKRSETCQNKNQLVLTKSVAMVDGSLGKTLEFHLTLAVFTYCWWKKSCTT